MNEQELTKRVLRIADRVKANQPVEDSLVELKRVWPTDIPKAARQIGGHINAARSDFVLWVIGIDERSSEITGADAIELANWWPQIKKEFRDLAPDLLLNLAVEGKTLVALLIEASRKPYVIKTPHGTPYENAVPWKEGTSTRMARREDILRLLQTIPRLPKSEVTDAKLKFGVFQPKKGGSQCPYFMFTCRLFLSSDEEFRIITHHCGVKLLIERRPLELRNFDFYQPEPGTTSLSQTTLIVDRAGSFGVKAYAPTRHMGTFPESITARVVLTISEADFEPVSIDIDLVNAEKIPNAGREQIEGGWFMGELMWNYYSPK